MEGEILLLARKIEPSFTTVVKKPLIDSPDLIRDRLKEQLIQNLSRDWLIEDVYVEVSSGSIKIKTWQVSLAMLGSMLGGIAIYPDIKKGAVEIWNDTGFVLEKVLKIQQRTSEESEKIILHELGACELDVSRRDYDYGIVGQVRELIISLKTGRISEASFVRSVVRILDLLAGYPDRKLVSHLVVTIIEQEIPAFDWSRLEQNLKQIRTED